MAWEIQSLHMGGAVVLRLACMVPIHAKFFPNTWQEAEDLGVLLSFGLPVEKPQYPNPFDFDKQMVWLVLKCSQ